MFLVAFYTPYGMKKPFPQEDVNHDKVFRNTAGIVVILQYSAAEQTSALQKRRRRDMG